MWRLSMAVPYAGPSRFTVGGAHAPQPVGARPTHSSRVIEAGGHGHRNRTLRRRSSAHPADDDQGRRGPPVVLILLRRSRRDEATWCQLMVWSLQEAARLLKFSGVGVNGQMAAALACCRLLCGDDAGIGRGCDT